MLAIGLQCPDCRTDIYCHEVVILEGVLYLIGLCPVCQIDLRFSSEKMHAQLQGIHLAPEPKMSM